MIQSNLSQDLDNLSNWFRDNELIFNLKKGKSEVVLFGTGKRLNLFRGCQVKLSVNDDPINTTTCYKYLGVHLDCLNGTACFPFKDYFQRLHHNALNTRNNGKTAKLPKVKLDFARRSFYFLGASIFNSLPLSLRNINSRVLFRKALDDYYL